MSAWLLILSLESFDQTKLAELIGNLPTTVRSKKVTRVVSSRLGFKVTSVFPKEDHAFRIKCESSYFNRSLYPSKTKCGITLDEKHPELFQANREFKVSIKDPQIVSALYQAIHYGKPRKEFRSFEKVYGLTFEGRKGYAFDYYFSCGLEDCILKFSNARSAVQ